MEHGCVEKMIEMRQKMSVTFRAPVLSLMTAPSLTGDGHSSQAGRSQ